MIDGTVLMVGLVTINALIIALAILLPKRKPEAHEEGENG